MNGIGVELHHFKRIIMMLGIGYCRVNSAGCKGFEAEGGLFTDKIMQKIYDENHFLKEQLKNIQFLYDQFMLPELHEYVSLILYNMENPLRPLCVQSRWGDVFVLLYHYLQWHPREWDGEAYVIDLDATSFAMGQEIAKAAGMTDYKKYILPRKKIHVLQDYYLEEGLMRVGADTPFTPRAEIVACRYAVCCGQYGHFKVMRPDGMK